MSRGTVLVATSLVAVVLAAGGAWFVRRRAHTEAGRVASAAASADLTWCGKPLGSRALGQLKDPSICSKISLTGTAPTCFFWADCGELHFEIDCGTAGPGQCRCDGEEGRSVPYNPAFCSLDPAQPSAGLRAVLASAATACQWNPK